MATLYVSASGDGLLVNITTGNQTLKVGDTDVKMSCRVNKGLPLLYNNYVQWLHVSNATGSSTETLLTSNTQIKANRSEATLPVYSSLLLLLLLLFRTFSCSGTHIWNSLPQDLTHCSALSSFKAKLKTVVF